MRVVIEPSVASGSINAPPSKSLSHRALICGALSGNSNISNLAFSNDINATLQCLKALGAKVDCGSHGAVVGELDPFNIPENATLCCGESGSTLRFLIPLCLLSGKTVTLKGAPRLFERPLDVYREICESQNILFKKDLSSLTVCGTLKNGEYNIKGDISSQFITGLMFALPLLNGDSIINVIGNFESASYIDLTLAALSSFGIIIGREGNRFFIKGNQRYNNSSYTVEGDCSNSAFLEALNLIGGKAFIGSVPENTLQGDIVYRDIFNGLKNGIKQFDLSDCPDLAPILFAVSAVFGGATFNGTARLKIKESDRATAMACELSKFGIELTVNQNSVIVHNNKLLKPKEVLCGHNDHRIVMSLAVLSTITGGTIDGAEAVSKSYPNFFSDLKNLNIGITRYETR